MLDISEKDFGKDSLLQLGYEPNRIDVLTDISDVKFKPAWENRVEASYGNQKSSLDGIGKGLITKVYRTFESG